MEIPEKPPVPAGLYEIRNLEVRDVDPDADGVKYWEFKGHAAVFDSLSENLGGFREVIKRGAFKDVLSQDVRFLVDHDSRYPLARSTAGNLKLTEDPTGLLVEAKVRSDLSYAQDLRANLEEGNVTQMSFAFGRNVEDDWEEDSEGRVVRTIRRFKELFDVSTVTYPAYPATDAGLRAVNLLRRGEEISDVERDALRELVSSSGVLSERDSSADVEELAVEESESVDVTGERGLSVRAARVRLLAHS